MYSADQQTQRLIALAERKSMTNLFLLFFFSAGSRCAMEDLETRSNFWITNVLETGFTGGENEGIQKPTRGLTGEETPQSNKQLKQMNGRTRN